MAPGASREYTAVVELPRKIRGGKYWLGITVDPFNRIAEPQPHPNGEHNNVTNIDIQIKAPRSLLKEKSIQPLTPVKK